MGDARFGKKDKNQHIQVFVRVRPMNNAETSRKSTTVIETSSNKEVVVYERLLERPSKKFTFDRVFGPSSKQVDVYNAVVSPLVEQVLAGYNCTVFAYGQTGTGKTFTMEGLDNDPALHWNSDTTTGMIPRALSHLFDELRLLDAQEYMVRVSFLELYNEELFDLLSPSDDTSKIRLFEDTSKKGAVIIHGLEEVTVHNKSEVYKILEKGSEKRQTAATLMNAHSSRSHTVFSITVHIKENTVEGEELLKIGKLNLVDLAGSENVGRSGAIDRRAREAGSINQSLLTLARVIMALVERTPHVPYRESKLTRLLQESLGGRTKTSIIATVSPASINLEETLSTLDYVHRAKNITNRPEINQKLSKKAVLKEYTEEIERLRRDLLAAREKNGVYLAHENYNEIQALITSQGKEIEEKLNNIKALEEAMQKKEKIFNELQTQYFTQKNELNRAKDKLNNVTEVLTQTTHQLQSTEYDRDEQKHLVERHLSTEKVLLSQAETLLTVANTATLDTHKLHDTIARKSQVEQKNEALGEQFRNNIAERIKNIEKDLLTYQEELKQFCTAVQHEIATQTLFECKNLDTAMQHVPVNFTNQIITTTHNLTQSVNDSYSHYQNWMQDEINNTGIMTERECESLSRISRILAPKIYGLVENEMTATLRILNDNLSQKVKYISSYVSDSINSICNYRLEDCDRICKNVKELKENLDCVLQHQNQMMEKRRLFAKMMEEVSAQFSLLYENEEENHSVVSGRFNHVNGVCTKINEEVTNSYNVNTNLNKNLEASIQNALGEIESNVATETKKNEKLAEMTAEEGKNLVSDLKSTISASCDGLRQHKNSFECNAKELQQKMKKDKGEILSSIDNVHKISVDVGASNAEYIEKQKVHVSKNSTEVVSKLENQSTQSLEVTDRIIEKLHATQHHVDKFFAEGIQRDIPTGATPVRKEFSYPRQFAVTSPHERILQRFREARRSVETSEDDDDTFMNGDTTMKQIGHSTAICDITFITSVEEDAVCDTLTPIGNSTLKHSSSCHSLDGNFQSLKPVSNIPTIPVPHRAGSESNIYIKNGNKENDFKFVKPGSVKGSQRSKLKTPKRQVLGMHN